MSTLMYNHAKDRLVTFEETKQLAIPQAMGRFHKPSSFHNYIEQVHEALDINGITLDAEEYAVQKDGNRLFGVMEISAEGQQENPDWNLLLGLRASHDGMVSRGLSLGSQVMVCSNLCFGGNLGTFRTRQTLNMESRIPTLIREALARVPELAEQQGKQFDEYKNYDIKTGHAEKILVDIFRNGGFSSSQLTTAVKEWDTPSYDEHAQYGDTLWKLFNASTQALKPTGTVGTMNTVQERSHIISDHMNQLVLS